MTRVLITGGTGFFGKSILDYFSRHDCPYDFTFLSRHGFGDQWLKSNNLKHQEVISKPHPPGRGGRPRPPAIDTQRNCVERRLRGAEDVAPYRAPSLSSGFEIDTQIKQLLGDVRTFELPLGTHFDYIIHAATPARADIPDDEMRSIIIDGTANAIRQAKKCGATKFMMVSSGGVYGKDFTRPVSEDDEPHPYTAYGKAKLEAERMAIDSGLHVLIPRCFAFVGKYLDRNAHFAIGNFIRDALAGKDIVINGDGTPMRSYMYADDLVEWLFAILERGTSGRPYNVGSPDAISIRDLAQTVLSTLNSCLEKVGQESRSTADDLDLEKVGRESRSTADGSNLKILGTPVPGAANYYVPVVTRAQSELGISLKYDLPAAMAESVKSA